MIRFNRTARKRSFLEITPLVDVVFLLLIFFLLTSTSMLRSMDVDLPGARSAEPSRSTSLVISLLADGSIRLDKEAVGLEQLGPLLDRHFSGAPPPLTIEADRRVSFERFARVLDAARLAGAREINLATDLTYEAP